MIDNLKDRLKIHLESLVVNDPKHSITAEDIRTFFEEEQAGRLQRKHQQQMKRIRYD